MDAEGGLGERVDRGCGNPPPTWLSKDHVPENYRAFGMVHRTGRFELVGGHANTASRKRQSSTKSTKPSAKR